MTSAGSNLSLSEIDHLEAWLAFALAMDDARIASIDARRAPDPLALQPNQR